MDITNFHGLASFLMEEAGGDGTGGGSGDGGGSTALATTTGTGVASAGDGTGDGTGGDGTGAALDTTGAYSTPLYEAGRVSQGVSPGVSETRELRTRRCGGPSVTRPGRTRYSRTSQDDVVGDKPFDKIKQLQKGRTGNRNLCPAAWTGEE